MLSSLSHSAVHTDVLITRHAFTGAYRLKIQTQEAPTGNRRRITCACGAVPEDTEHVLLYCPLTHVQRLHHLSEDGLPDSLRKLFDSLKRCLEACYDFSGARLWNRAWVISTHQFTSPLARLHTHTAWPFLLYIAAQNHSRPYTLRQHYLQVTASMS